jgi:hypothetical protein
MDIYGDKVFRKKVIVNNYKSPRKDGPLDFCLGLHLDRLSYDICYCKDFPKSPYVEKISIVDIEDYVSEFTVSNQEYYLLTTRVPFTYENYGKNLSLFPATL